MTGCNFVKNDISQKRNTNRKSPQAIFFARSLIFKLQQEALKFNDNYVFWSWPKTDLEVNSLNLENQRLEKVSFSQ